ncbi:uncharacterized protein FFB14_13471 [Fusarium fujikuroi]|nr:uncharacterized protein FFB14_13471 [Fusarium fujikuroi]
MSTNGCISSRAVTYLPQAPKFFDVLDDLWEPQTNPRGLINLGLAENASMQTELIGYINSKLHATSHALTYGDGFTGSKRLKQAFCHFLNKRFRPAIPLVPKRLLITP